MDKFEVYEKTAHFLQGYGFEARADAYYVGRQSNEDRARPAIITNAPAAMVGVMVAHATLSLCKNNTPIDKAMQRAKGLVPSKADTLGIQEVAWY